MRNRSITLWDWLWWSICNLLYRSCLYLNLYRKILVGLNRMAECCREYVHIGRYRLRGRLFHRFACYLRVKVLICNSQKKRRALKRQGVFSEAGLQRRLKLFPPPSSIASADRLTLPLDCWTPYCSSIFIKIRAVANLVCPSNYVCLLVIENNRQKSSEASSGKC